MARRRPANLTAMGPSGIFSGVEGGLTVVDVIENIKLEQAEARKRTLSRATPFVPIIGQMVDQSAADAQLEKELVNQAIGIANTYGDTISLDLISQNYPNVPIIIGGGGIPSVPPPYVPSKLPSLEEFDSTLDKFFTWGNILKLGALGLLFGMVGSVITIKRES